MKLLLALLLCLTAFAKPSDDLYERLIDFDKHYQRFVFRLCGWPEGKPSDGPCRASLGTFDYREFRLAGEMAAKLWPRGADGTQ